MLEGLVLHLRRDYDVHTALSGEKALQKLKEIHGAAVIVSDMRMPGMDGAQLLKQVLKHYPETTRILLTGEPGRDAAIAAVNEAQIFRFLTKPCPPDQLKAAIEAGVTAVPAHECGARRSFRRPCSAASRRWWTCWPSPIPSLSAAPTGSSAWRWNSPSKLDCAGFWQLEAAAMLSQIGYVSLPAELCEKLYYGKKLTPEEATLAEGVPQIAINLLEHIPRLEPVMQILMALQWRDEAIVRLGDGTIGLGTRILALVLEYDGLVAQGANPSAPRCRPCVAACRRYGADLLEKFAAHVGSAQPKSEAAHDSAAGGRRRHDHDAGSAHGRGHPPRPARAADQRLVPRAHAQLRAGAAGRRGQGADSGAQGRSDRLNPVFLTLRAAFPDNPPPSIPAPCSRVAQR